MKQDLMKKDLMKQKTQNSEFSKELQIQLYKDMILYRRFEERVHVAYTTRRKFAGFCHLHIGHAVFDV